MAKAAKAAKSASEWPNGRYLTGLQKVADFYELSLKTVKQWRTQGMPDRTSQGWDLLAIIRWRDKRMALLAGGRVGAVDRMDAPAADADKASLAEQKRVAEVISNRKKLLELQEMQGKLVDADAARAQFEQMGNAVRQRLEALPGELASSVPPEIRPDFLADATHKVRLACLEIDSWGDE